MSAPAWLSRATLSLRAGGEGPRGSDETYIVHQAVADLFGDRPAGDRGYLYRVTERRGSDRDVLVLSDDEPLPLERIAFRPWIGVTGLESKLFAPTLQAGQTLEFQVRVNATRVVTDPEQQTAKGKPKKQRFDVWDVARRAGSESLRTPEAAYHEWLDRQVEGGAVVGQLGVVERGEEKPSRGIDLQHRRTRRIHLVYAELVGRLMVEDPAHLLNKAISGVGRGRAFGCGLLLLWPAGSLPHRKSRGP